MADINLLGGENKSSFNLGTTSASLAVKALVVVAVLVVLYYGYLRVQISRTRNSIQSTISKTNQLKSQAVSSKERGEVITRQGQLKNLNTLIKNHLYWSGMLPELARVTLKTASYSSITADSTGLLNMEVLVPDYTSADKYLQVFDLPQFNEQFSDVKVLSITKQQKDDQVQTSMKLQLKFNPEFIHKTLQ